jgi:fructose-1,6-bisphosphatase I
MTTHRGDAHLRPGSEGRTAKASARNCSLEEFLGSVANRRNDMQALGVLIQLVAKAAIQIADLVALGHIAGTARNDGASDGSHNEPVQKYLDGSANDAFVKAIRLAPVAAVLSEGLSEVLLLDPAASLAVALDPLNGSSNIETNVSVGTIFAVYPAFANALQPADHFLRPGCHQIAAGFILYGPQTCFVLTLGEGVQVFTLDRRTNTFRLTIPDLRVPEDSIDYSANTSNYRHWDNSTRAYVDDCLRGAKGPLCRDHSMHWTSSFVANVYRILVRGGVFLDPGDHRREDADLRLRLIHEANPIAFLVEQAGGCATDTVKRILDIWPHDPHARTSIVFGSSAAVARIALYHTDPEFSAERAPLFHQRGLIRR